MFEYSKVSVSDMITISGNNNFAKPEEAISKYQAQRKPYYEKTDYVLNDVIYKGVPVICGKVNEMSGKVIINKFDNKRILSPDYNQIIWKNEICQAQLQMYLSNNKKCEIVKTDKDGNKFKRIIEYNDEIVDKLLEVRASLVEGKPITYVITGEYLYDQFKPAGSLEYVDLN